LRLPTEDKPLPLRTLTFDLLWCEDRINAWAAKLRERAAQLISLAGSNSRGIVFRRGCRRAAAHTVYAANSDHSAIDFKRQVRWRYSNVPHLRQLYVSHRSR
jgi:hypothetical protein